MSVPIEEFADFVAARWGALFRFAYLLTGSFDQAEEAAQRALVSTCAALPRIRSAAALEGYVRRTLVNDLISRRRARVREVTIEAAPELADIGPDLDLQLTLLAALKSLAPRQRAVIVMRYYDDLSIDQTAAEMGCTAGTVKKLGFQAMANLRLALGENFESRRTDHV